MSENAVTLPHLVSTKLLIDAKVPSRNAIDSLSKLATLMVAVLVLVLMRVHVQNYSLGIDMYLADQHFQTLL